mgnify:CR=1 FL=1
MTTMNPPLAPQKPKLLDRVRLAVRAHHYSSRTEEAYVAWIKRYIFFHGKRHPAEMGAEEVTRFLSSLALDGRVAASTQNQALSALLFLYREVLQQALPWLEGVVRAKRPIRLPVVLTREEVQAVLAHLRGTPLLMGTLLYGAGLRRELSRTAPALGMCPTAGQGCGVQCEPHSGPKRQGAEGPRNTAPRDGPG